MKSPTSQAPQSPTIPEQRLQLIRRKSRKRARAPETPLPALGLNLLFGRGQLAGSLIGGLPQTQEMLDFYGEHGIVCDIEMIPIQKINEAHDRLLKSDVKYRFVIDMASLK